MFLTNLKRVLKTAAQNFWRNGSINIATTGIMTMTLLSISILIMLNFLGNSAIENFKNRIDISVYFFSDAPEVEIAKVQADASALPDVKSVVYLSKDEAWEKFKEKYSENQVIAQGVKELDSNPLYATLSVKAKNIDDYQKISDFLAQQKYSSVISRINFDQSKKEINKLSAVTKSVQKGGLGLSVIFAIISIFVVFNAIRITLHNYRHEIKIMGLVGAESWYIQLPFMVEGALYGILGSIISTIILVILVYSSADIIDRLLSGVTLVSYLKQNIAMIFGVQLAAGVLIGVMSSIFAMRKYLRV